MTTAHAVAQLRRFIKRLVKDGINSSAQFTIWRKEEKNAAFMARCLGYERLDGMPAATALVQPFFHPTKPFIGLNYSKVAHATLHKFPTGWTLPIRLCRGIVFERTGRLLAVPFPKFFNYGETAETSVLPDQAFEATVKQDGHLGIIFEYEGELFITTRGSFVSKTSVLATKMLDAYREKWRGVYPVNVSTLVEIIHPETEVFVKYDGAENFTVIGAFNRRSLKDAAYAGLRQLGKKLNLPVTPRWSGKNLQDLIDLMRDPTIRNQEGYVVRFACGLRVKLKFKTYIALMFMDKLAPRWVMTRLSSNSLYDRIDDITGAPREAIDRLTAEVLKVKEVSEDHKTRLQYLYGLEPESTTNAYYRTICRKFLKWVENPEAVSEADEEADEAGVGVHACG